MSLLRVACDPGCAHAAVRWHGYAEQDRDALIGRFGLAAAPAPVPGS